MLVRPTPEELFGVAFFVALRTEKVLSMENKKKKKAFSEIAC